MNRRGTIRTFVSGKFVMGAALEKRIGDRFGGEHAGLHRVMRALDARHIHEARGATDEGTTGKYKLRHCLKAALGNARAP